MSEKGFTILNILILILPLVLCCMLVVGSYQFITKYSVIQGKCRSHVLKAQQLLGKKLKALIDLNPQAQKLRKEEARLRKIIASLASIPPATVPFVKLLEINLLRQGILRGRQEILVSSAKSKARSVMRALMISFPSHVRGSYSSVNLMVYKKPQLAIAPDYLPVPFFTELQAIKVQWQINIHQVIPTFLLKLFSKFPQNITGQCAATLTKGRDTWNPKLHQARF